MCVVQLRRSLLSPGSTLDVVSASKQAKDVLEREMSKPGSASSRSSCPEFGIAGLCNLSTCFLACLEQISSFTLAVFGITIALSALSLPWKNFEIL